MKTLFIKRNIFHSRLSYFLASKRRHTLWRYEAERYKKPASALPHSMGAEALQEDICSSCRALVPSWQTGNERTGEGSPNMWWVMLSNLPCFIPPFISIVFNLLSPNNGILNLASTLLRVIWAMATLYWIIKRSHNVNKQKSILNLGMTDIINANLTVQPGTFCLWMLILEIWSAYPLKRVLYPHFPDGKPGAQRS